MHTSGKRIMRLKSQVRQNKPTIRGQEGKQWKTYAAKIGSNICNKRKPQIKTCENEERAKLSLVARAFHDARNKMKNRGRNVTNEADQRTPTGGCNE